MRPDRHRLKNLSAARKLLASAGLLTGLLLFYSAHLFGVFFTSWTWTPAAVLGWGSRLMQVRAHAPAVYHALFAAHAASLVLIVVVTTRLFRLVAMPRGARTALIGTLRALGALDLSCWLLLPVWHGAGTVLGATLVGESLLLVYLVGRPLRDMWWYRRWRSGGRRRVVVVGGGFAGLHAALGLDRALGWHRDLEIVVMDRRNYFLFPPLLPSVATGAIETRQVTYPFRRIFEATNVVFRKELVCAIDPERRVVRSRVDVDHDPATGRRRSVESETTYDWLVLAPGSDTQTFGTPGVAEHAFFMREVGDAVAVRNQIIDCFERAAREPSAVRRAELLSFVVVGAGPTGVELAAEVHDLIANVLLRRYPEIDPELARVWILQSGDAILPGWHASVVRSAAGRLAQLRVEVVLGDRVVRVDPAAVVLKSGRVIAARTCVWCAGVKPAALLAAAGLPTDRAGRVPVEPDLRVAGRPDVFVLGDSATTLHGGKPLPPLGQVAFQQGSHTARNLVRLLCGRATRPFRYFDYGSLVSVGEHFAAVDLLGVRLSGFVAWLVWRTLYLTKLVGFGNRVRVCLDWTLDLLVERSISQISATRQDLAEQRGDPRAETVAAAQ